MAKKRIHLGPHKYQRVKWGKNGTIIWRCALPSCPHYTHPEFISGKVTLCWDCGQPCLIDTVRITRVKPKCDGCIKSKDRDKDKEEKKIEVKEPLSEIEQLLKGLNG
jgi:hypothetical protein